MKARLASLGLAAVVGVAVMLLVSASALARASGHTYVSNNNGKNVPACFDANSKTCSGWKPLGNGTKVDMICWVDAQNYTGNYKSPRWFWISVTYGFLGPTVQLYVHSSYVFNQVKTPRCY